MKAPNNTGSLSKRPESAPAKQPANFAQYVKQPAVLASIEKTLGNASKRETFVAALISAVTTNKALSECDPNSIVSAALLGESLKLPPSPQLGYFYMVPYSGRAQFQIGYKGYIQLAQRTGFFRRINVTSIKEGELISWDPFTEELKYQLHPNRNKLQSIGYYAFFELTNGFKKAIYMSYEEMLDHADTYSKAFSKEAYARIQAGEIQGKDLKRFSSFWYKNFDGMAYKTMLRQLIGKWAPMSVEMQQAIETDYKVDDEKQPIEGDFIDVDFTVSEFDPIDEPTEEPENAETGEAQA